MKSLIVVRHEGEYDFSYQVIENVLLYPDDYVLDISYLRKEWFKTFSFKKDNRTKDGIAKNPIPTISWADWLVKEHGFQNIDFVEDDN